MSLSSCEHCWDVLCCCGYQYLTMSVKDLDELITILTKVKTIIEKHGQLKGYNPKKQEEMYQELIKK